MKIVIPYIIAIIFTILAYLLTGQLTPRKIFNSLVEGEPVVSVSNYYFICSFLFISQVSKKEKNDKYCSIWWNYFILHSY